MHDERHDCQCFQHCVQQFLDRNGANTSNLIETPLRDCPQCRLLARSADRLASALPLPPLPQPPSAFTDRIIAQAIRELKPALSTSRRRLAFATLAAAASVLFVLSVRPFFVKKAPITNGPVVSPVVPAQNPDRPMRESVAMAGDALASLTTRAKTEWIPPMPQVADSWKAPELAPLEESARPFVEAGAGMSASLEPVAASAKRAVSLFMRDLPGGRGTEADPKEKPKF
jgi:hypothetical protein